MTVSTISPEVLIIWQPNLIGRYIIIAWVFCVKVRLLLFSFLFKVKITVKVKNFIESLCILYPLCHWSLDNQGCHWSLGNQRRCADVLFIVTKPSTTKWAYDILTVALWLTLSLGTQVKQRLLVCVVSVCVRARKLALESVNVQHVTTKCNLK